MGGIDDCFGRYGTAGDIRSVAHTDQAHGAVFQFSPEAGKIEGVVFPRLAIIDLDQPFFLQSEPRDEIRVMFPIGEQNNVAGTEGKTEGDHVNGLAGIGGEDDLLFGAGIDEVGDNPARAFYSPFRIAVNPRGDFIGKPMPAPVASAGRIFFIIIRHRPDDRLGNQRGASVIEIDGKLAVSFYIQGWEIFSDRFPRNVAVTVKRRIRHRRYHRK